MFWENMLQFHNLIKYETNLSLILIWVAHFMPIVSSWKTSGFLMFPGGIERDLWHEMGLNPLVPDVH